MTPTEVLKHEHQIILMVLGAAGREAQRVQAGGALNAGLVEQMLDFFRSFADRCHHAKEEKLLFVRMEERGVPVEGGPIAVMLAEHEEGRRRVRAAGEALARVRAGDDPAATAMAEHLGAYAQLLRSHIGKEDGVLFPMADRLLTLEDQRELAAEFERVEAEEIGAGVHDRYHALAHELAG